MIYAVKFHYTHPERFNYKTWYCEADTTDEVQVKAWEEIERTRPFWAGAYAAVGIIKITELTGGDIVERLNNERHDQA